ncbi:hypothetical protein GGF32_006500 [Allomyces javanicus]|nr:hypothetical protein GGF32_006500 [Allomyces javanicus]
MVLALIEPHCSLQTVHRLGLDVLDVFERRLAARVLSRTGIRLEDFRDLLRRTDAFVSGSVFHYLSGDIPDRDFFETSDVDVYCQSDSDESIDAFLVQSGPAFSSDVLAGMDLAVCRNLYNGRRVVLSDAFLARSETLTSLDIRSFRTRVAKYVRRGYILTFDVTAPVVSEIPHVLLDELLDASTDDRYLLCPLVLSYLAATAIAWLRDRRHIARHLKATILAKAAEFASEIPDVRIKRTLQTVASTLDTAWSNRDWL